MRFNEYEDGARSTAFYPGREEFLGMLYCAIGLAGEAGEVANKVKKVIRDSDGMASFSEREAIAHELGDVLWYVTELAEEIGFKLEDIALWNLQKLESRRKRGVIGGSGDNR